MLPVADRNKNPNNFVVIQYIQLSYGYGIYLGLRAIFRDDSLK